MPRFLTPARICLLVLVKLYQDGQHSSESGLPLLEFLAQHTVNSTSASPDSAFAPIDERQTLFSSDISFLAAKLQQWSSKFPGRNLYDILLWYLWQCSGLDALYSLISESTLCYRGAETHPGIHKNPFTPASPFGQYLRRCYVEFTRLQFEDTLSIWNAFAAFRAPTYDDWVAKNADAAAEMLQNEPDTNVPAVPKPLSAMNNASDTASASVIDAEVLLNFAIHRLQKVGARVPDDVKSKLEQWIGDQSDSSTRSLHFFMAFFEHWRAGQYTMALESLHRYFDYSIASKTANDNMRIYYQYALLHLSVLHADFECWDESVDAMNECITTARENQDAACLNFALSWLLYLRHAYPENSDGSGTSFESIATIVGSGNGQSDEIAFLKQKAKDGKHWMLLSSTLLEEAKLEIYSGGSANRAQEHVLQAMHLNIQHDLRTLSPATAHFQGACLDRLGLGHLARCTFELASLVHSSHCPLNDGVRSACRLAHTLAQGGHFAKAMATLEDLAPTVKGVLKLEQRLKAFAALIQLKRHLHRGDIQIAEDLYRELRSFWTDSEIIFELHLLNVEILSKEELYEKALAKVGDRLRELKDKGSDLGQRLYLLLLKARIYTMCGQAARGFTIALRATATAERHLLISVQLEGIAVLGKILIELSEFEAARDIIEAALPHALESNNAYLTARLFTAMGEACVGFAGHNCQAGSSEQMLSMRRAQDLIERGRTAYHHTEDLSGMLDCLAMKSRIASWSGDDTSAASADDMYYQLLESRDAAPT